MTRSWVFGLALAMAASATAMERSVQVGGATRAYEVHLPNDHAPSGPTALVLVFHGGGGNARNAARMSGMDAKADREGFIVAYPNGTPQRPGGLLRTWNTWRCCGRAFDDKIDDVAFIRAVVDDVARDYPIDRRRIYATGFSNGGMLAYRVGCEMGDVIAAIAPVAGALNNFDCLTGPRVSVIVFHGTEDGHVRFEGGLPITRLDNHVRADNGVQFALDVWKQRDACDTPPVRERKGNVIHTTFECADGTGVELYALQGHAHAWPQSATDLLWEFFAKHPKAVGQPPPR